MKISIKKTSGGLYYFEDDTTVVTCLDGSSVVCNVGTVQQLHCFPIVSSQVLKVTLQEERWGGLMERKKKGLKKKRGQPNLKRNKRRLDSSLILKYTPCRLERVTV